jgi:D-arabinose 1-dehydrogenase-like Zn-dependent alcohol dehydrogenase
MRAAVVVEPKKLVVNEVSKPVCGDNDIVLKIHKA